MCTPVKAGGNLAPISWTCGISLRTARLSRTASFAELHPWTGQEFLARVAGLTAGQGSSDAASGGTRRGRALVAVPLISAKIASGGVQTGQVKRVADHGADRYLRRTRSLWLRFHTAWSEDGNDRDAYRQEDHRW
ncbi:hypothetical protein AL036_00520 [Salipiger aestuarii]|nr:hypothetical protein C357_21810 [Citreicella sp. 357]KAA8610402.1 hypothetical protein AL036_00520 [Salipiger aestuarii]KAB2543487.1 hypothetical protein AL035_01470 [Salipiger aestuarii]